MGRRVASSSLDAGFQAPPVEKYVDDGGREFGYVHIRHPEAVGLVVHFSAFFGKWGEYRQYRETFSGYFHRMRMLGSDRTHNWLFMCDTYGAFDNGTYYTGERGDFFVERAVLDIVELTMAADGVGPSQVVMVGSSMGGTAALKFGLLLGVRGIAAIGPHIDLDVCAQLQDRYREVAFICPDGDPLAVHNRPYTRQIRRLLDGAQTAPPRLFIQACVDDAGVYQEQVVPLVDEWQAHGGQVDVDFRARGGHTSDYATRALLLDAIGRLADGRPIDVHSYQSNDLFKGKITRLTALQQVRPILGRMRARFRSKRRSEK